MTKTAKQIVGDILNLIKGSLVEKTIDGAVYRGNRGKSNRPKGSKKEDVVVYFTTGDPSQMQSGVLAINVYVPDIPFGGGYVENGRRCEELEIVAQQWVDSLTTGVSDYRFELQQTIYTEDEVEINQHFVVIKLKYYLLTT